MLRNKPGTLLNEPVSLATSGGSRRQSIKAMQAATAPISKKAARQPKCCPTTVLSGTPITVASELPTMTMARPLAFIPCGVMRTTMGVVMDQNTACALAMQMRASIRVVKLGARAESTCPAMNTTNRPISSLRRSTRAVSAVSGKESRATLQAYMATRSPVKASVSPRSLAISGSSPMGRTSVVTNMKAARAREKTGTQRRLPSGVLIEVMI